MGLMSNRCNRQIGVSYSRTLASARQGSRVRILSIAEGCSLRERLAELGLFPGVEIEVVRNSSSGPFVIGIAGSRMALGRGVAVKIEVV